MNALKQTVTKDLLLGLDEAERILKIFNEFINKATLFGCYFSIDF